MTQKLPSSIRSGRVSYRRAVLTLAILLMGLPMLAQTISGKVVSSEGGQALPGVSILVKGTTSGTTTRTDGTYTLNVPNPSSVLIYSFIGFEAQEVPVGSKTTINVTLTVSTQALNEVVVTALGISKQQRNLGYVTQKIDNSALSQARETNLVSQLAGKIAGVTVVNSPSGIGGSSRITIRGEKSLNINANQPLFVIDGLPINNNFVGSSGRNNQDADYGNGAGFINPDDVETMTVLKGASATALYGSRAANGVVVITTKTGKGTKGIGVSVNSNVTFESVLRLPDYQNVYGQGLNGEFAFKDGSGGGLRDGVDESWGPKMDGRLIVQHDSPTDKGYRAGDTKVPGGPGVATPTPFIAHPNSIRDFFETGRIVTNNVAVTGSNDKGDFRMSFTNLDQKGFVPNTDLTRNTFNVNAGYKLTDRFTARTNVSYIRNHSDNRPNLSYGTENIMYLLNCWWGRHIDMASMRNYWQPGLEGIQQFNFNYNYHDNPYFNMYENTNGQDINRVIGNVTLSYQLTDWLSVQGRTQVDYQDELRVRQRAFSTQRYPYGSYRREAVKTMERNTDLLFLVDKRLNDAFTLSGTLGGNQRLNKYDYIDNFAPQLTVPGVYSLNNSRVPLEYSQNRSDRRINSMFASAQLTYLDKLTLEMTGRNDWSSTLTLPQGVAGMADNSYFYWSGTLSAVVSDWVKLPEWVSFAKVRAGYAQVGNDTEPYQFSQPFNPGTPWGTTPTFSESTRIPNLSLKPEISSSQEYGFDLRFLKNRVGLDFTYYNTISKNQIIFLPLSGTTGYSQIVQNAGRIQNNGIEVMLNLTPIRMDNIGFRWDMNVNFSRNRSKVLELANGVSTYELASRYFSVQARVNERMGDMYGYAYERVSSDPKSPYYDPTGQNVGQMVITADGRPISTTTLQKLGNYNPDWLAGINNSFKYKGFNLSFLFDIRKGGEVYSHTYVVGREAGQLVETLQGRENGYYDNSVDRTFTNAPAGTYYVVPGVVKTGEGQFATNARRISAREWHTAFTLGRRVLEDAIFDASFTKLREVKLGYSLPNSIMGRKLPFRNVTVSLVGRNLFLWTKVPHIDPETASVSGGTIIPGSESVAIPSARNYGVNLSFNL
ncbi:SusC/RagA family TonB-linked outer membrane protein [Larkinella sp. C7]|uniref:SusC/RagA family TonB-linked outer membrane protein n=1 Tax=Larkinella sp. C7 TaxID=2576607 RepID=UPI001110FF63|nr:SusC/RagA family TonB-linked outer membrane protein [Larkinella sp. C7]